MKTDDREALLARAPEISLSALSSYYSKFGPEVRSLLDLHVIQDQGSFHILNSELNVRVSKERLERSITKCVPLGKTMSHRVLYSERVGEIKQDFDSKEYIGGPVPLKTETIPTYPARASAGGGDTVQNVGYGNAIYYGEGDIQTIADNFAAMNDQLSNLSISFKGPATIRDLEDTLAGTFILESAS